MTKENTDDKVLSPYSVASGLIAQDYKILPLLYLLLIFPQLISNFFEEMPALLQLSLERLAQLVFISIVTLRWIKTFKKENLKLNVRSLIAYFITGYLVWMTVLMPLLIPVVEGNMSGAASLSVFLLIPALFLLNKYFFYFFPMLNGITNPRKVMESSLSITQAERNLPYKTLITGFGYLSLIVTSLLAFSPDGRSLTVNFLVGLASGILWLIHTYVSLGAALVHWSDKDWHENKLEPYRNARLASISFAAPRLLTHFLLPKQGLLALSVSLLIWFGNMLALEGLKPAPEITIVSAAMKDDKTLSVVLDLEDKEYEFRGFQPLFFHLAGEKGVVVSEGVKVFDPAKPEDDIKFGLQQSDQKVKLQLDFQCTRNAEGMKKLEDLYLWYRSYRLYKIKL